MSDRPLPIIKMVPETGVRMSEEEVAKLHAFLDPTMQEWAKLSSNCQMSTIVSLIVTFAMGQTDPVTALSYIGWRATELLLQA